MNQKNQYTVRATEALQEAFKSAGARGNPETTPGGRALKFYSSIRLDVRRIASIKEGDMVSGSRVRAKVVKNKVAAPFRESELDIMFDSGISIEGDLLDLAITDGIILKSGAWFSYKDVRLGQGRENVKQFLRDNPDLCEELRAALIAKRLPQGEKPSHDAASDKPRVTPATSAPKTATARRRRA